MASDEKTIQPQSLDFFVNRSLDASHISQDAARRQKVFEPGKISVVIRNGSAQKNKVAPTEIFVDGRTGNMDYVLLYGVGQSFFVFVNSDDLTVRKILADGLGKGTADYTETDKSDFL